MVVDLLLFNIVSYGSLCSFCSNKIYEYEVWFMTDLDFFFVPRGSQLVLLYVTKLSSHGNYMYRPI